MGSPRGDWKRALGLLQQLDKEKTWTTRFNLILRALTSAHRRGRKSVQRSQQRERQHP